MRAGLLTGIDARFYCGKFDLSELPEAYKNASLVRSQITKFGLGEVGRSGDSVWLDHGRRLGGWRVVERQIGVVRSMTMPIRLRLPAGSISLFGLRVSRSGDTFSLTSPSDI